MRSNKLLCEEINMDQYLERFKVLAQDCASNFESMDSVPEEQYDREYVQVRERLLQLLYDSKSDLPAKDFDGFEEVVIEFLCKNMGCSLDMKVLERCVPSTLSEEKADYIKSNSGLGRWL